MRAYAFDSTGESERKLREAFEAAEATAKSGRAAVIFLDEVDALCPRRDSQHQHEARVVAQLLTLIDGASSQEGESQSRRQLKHALQSVKRGLHASFLAHFESYYVILACLASLCCMCQCMLRTSALHHAHGNVKPSEQDDVDSEFTNQCLCASATVVSNRRMHQLIQLPDITQMQCLCCC